MKRILLVDDEYALVETLRALLEEEGYRVVTAANGEEGLARLAEEQPDLILLDVMMPRMNGLEAMRRLRESDAWRSVPIILMSAVVDPTRHYGYRVSALHKPFSLDTLLARIREQIGS